MADKALEEKEEEQDEEIDENEDDDDSSDNGDDDERGSRRGRSSRRSQRSQQRGRQQSRSYHRRRRYSRRRVCAFCADKTLTIDWKKTDNLRRFVVDSGSILPRRKSGLCAKHQRQVAVAIKRARHMALFPYTTEHVRIMSKR